MPCAYSVLLSTTVQCVACSSCSCSRRRALRQSEVSASVKMAKAKLAGSLHCNTDDFMALDSSGQACTLLEATMSSLSSAVNAEALVWSSHNANCFGPVL
jgi:hypothetical protein